MAARLPVQASPSLPPKYTMRSYSARLNAFFSSRDLRWVSLTFVTSRLIIVLIMLLARRTVASGPFSEVSHQMEHGGTLRDLFTQWDGVWYRMIATHGYSPPASHLATSFFPFYPILIRCVMWIVPDVQSASVFVSNLCFIGASLLLYRLLRLDHDETFCRRVIIFLMFGPMSFYFSAAYSESTFFLLTVGAAMAARREKWLAACLLAALAAATRPPGLLVAVLLFAELILQWKSAVRPFNRLYAARLSCFGVIPLGLLTYFGYCYYAFGDFLKPIHTHNLGWKQQLTLPWQTFTHPLNFTPNYMALYQSLVLLAIAGIVLAIALRLRLSYNLYAIASILFVLSWGTIEGGPRYASVIFPVYGGFAACATRWRWTYEPLLALEVALLGLCSVLFANAYQIT